MQGPPLVDIRVVHARRLAKIRVQADALEANLMSLAATIEKNRPTGCKGKLWNTAYITSTMGPSIKLDLASLKS